MLNDFFDRLPIPRRKPLIMSKPFWFGVVVVFVGFALLIGLVSAAAST